MVDEWGNFIVDQHTQSEQNLVASERYPSLFPFQWLAEYGKAIPGIPLYRTLDSEFPIEFAFDDDFGSEGPPDDVVEQGIFRRLFEVRLGLGPVGASGKIDLVFDQRRFDEIWVAEELRCNVNLHFIPPSLEPHSKRSRSKYQRSWSGEIDTFNFESPVGVYSSAEAWKKICGGGECWMRDEPLDDESTPAYETPAYELTDDIEPSAASSPKSREEFYDRALSDQFIEAVDPKTCRKYLGRQERLQCSVELSLPIITEAPWGTIAAQIEANLDLEDDEKRIDTLLMNTVRQHCVMLEECLERRRGLINKRKHKLYARYGTNEEER